MTRVAAGRGNRGARAAGWPGGLALLLAAAVAAPAAASHGPAASLEALGLEGLLEVPVEKVSAASRYEQQVNHVPASVTIVTADEIRRSGYRTLAEVLRGVRGLYLAYDRNYTNLGIRGFQRPGDFNTRLLLLVDGHRINDNLYDSAMTGSEAILDVELIERVEVIRGPGSSIHGSNAFFGVINVITRDAAHIDGVETSLQGGSRDAYKGVATLGYHGARARAVVSGSLYDAQGHARLYYPEFDDGASDGVARNADAEDAGKLFAKGSMGGFAFSAAFAERTKQVPTASYGTMFNDGREITTDRSEFVDLSYRRAVGGGEASARAYYDRYEYRGAYPYNYAAPGDPADVVVWRDENYADAVGVQAQYVRSLGARHRITAGAEWRSVPHLRQTTFTGNPRAYSFRDQRSAESVALYGQDEWSPYDTVLVTAGARYDRYGRFEDMVSPRLGVIYNPTERTSLKAIYGQAHRTPNAYEMYLASPGYSKSNLALEAETIENYELAADHRVSEHLRLGASAYHMHIHGLLSERVDPVDGLHQFENRGRIGAVGVELQLGGRVGVLTADLGYALQRAEDKATGERLDNSPQHLVSLDLALPLLPGRLDWTVQAQHVAEVSLPEGGRLAPYTVVDATLLGREWLPGLDLSLTVYNVLDEDYAHPGSSAHVQDAIPQDGRSLRLSATWHFGSTH